MCVCLYKYVVVGLKMASMVIWQEEMVKKKYGGLLSKKPPLISKVISSKSCLSMVDLMTDALCFYLNFDRITNALSSTLLIGLWGK